MPYPKSKDSEKCVAVSASVHIHNAHIKGTQHKSMMKTALRAEGDTSWVIQTLQVLSPLKEILSGYDDKPDLSGFLCWQFMQHIRTLQYHQYKSYENIG